MKSSSSSTANGSQQITEGPPNNLFLDPTRGKPWVTTERTGRSYALRTTFVFNIPSSVMRKETDGTAISVHPSRGWVNRAYHALVPEIGPIQSDLITLANGSRSADSTELQAASDRISDRAQDLLLKFICSDTQASDFSPNSAGIEPFRTGRLHIFPGIPGDPDMELSMAARPMSNAVAP